MGGFIKKKKKNTGDLQHLQIKIKNFKIKNLSSSGFLELKKKHKSQSKNTHKGLSPRKQKHTKEDTQMVNKNFSTVVQPISNQKNESN